MNPKTRVKFRKEIAANDRILNPNQRFKFRAKNIQKHIKDAQKRFLN